jgi:2-methylisocitrate lyase-like PEP mutase family enzyme
MPSLASEFHALHSPAAPLRLLNAWDAGSARVLEAAGAVALGTTSAGVSWAHGVRDGQSLSVDTTLRAIEAIASAVAVPVTADLESGYGDPGATVRRAVDAGAVGFNLEDGAADGTLRPLEAQLDLLAAAISAAAASGAFVNARTDALWLRLPDALAISCERAGAYAAAGAHGVFVPGAASPADLRALVAAVSGTNTTINVLTVPGLPSVAELSSIGIARISTGSRPILTAYSAVDAAAREILSAGTYDLATSGPLGYPDVNALMKG